MLGIGLIIIGAGVMTAGVLMLGGWVSGKSGSTGGWLYDRLGETKTDRQILYLYFVGTVVLPLLAGATMVLFGLHHLP